MTDDQVRALLIVAALWTGVTNSASFLGGRMSAPVPPAEVRYVTIPTPVAVPSAVAAPPAADAALIEPAPQLPVAVAEPEPAVSPPEVKAKPLPRPRPNVETRPKPKPRSSRALPSCAVVEREYQAMSWPERMAAYKKATPEQIAHGKRCLGL